MSDETILTPEELKARYCGRISLKTLANWRSTGGGPSFTKVGSRVFYRLPDILDWERRRTMKAG
jgi:hypothetical protein